MSPLGALVSTHAEYDHLFDIYVPIAAGVFVLVILVIAFAILRFRGPRTTSRRAELTVGEAGYAVILACVVAFLLFETFTAEHKVDTVADHERPSLSVDVTGARWEWAFRYPAMDYTAHAGEVGDQPLVVPANRAVRFNLTSLDVIHSLWIPAVDFKRDLIQGAIEHVTLTFTQLGTFRGQCAEFCGLHHPEMVFRVEVLSPSAFARWSAAHLHQGGVAA